MKKKQLRIPLIAMCVVCMASLVWACSVPVFRYALERWPNDQYEVVIFHKGKLTNDQQKLVTDLTEEGAAGKQHTNIRTWVVDLATVDSENPKDPELIKLWEKQKTETLPWIVVKYPAISRKPVDVWAGELTPENTERLIDSPARREIARRLLKGETAVWIFLESGTKSKDDAAFKKLEAELLLAEKELKLPEIDEADIAQGLISIDEGGLKLKFSTVRLSRDNSPEKMLIEMLLGSEDDLRDFDEPMAFPVFGRGRVMYALIGKGINVDTIRQSCQELIGPCTCEVKEENPGIDLITSVDWENLVQAHIEIDRELPPLPGFGGIVDAEDSAEMDAVKSDANAPAEGTSVLVANAELSIKPDKAAAVEPSTGISPMVRNIFILAGAGIVIVLLMSLFIMSRKSG